MRHGITIPLLVTLATQFLWPFLWGGVPAWAQAPQRVVLDLRESIRTAIARSPEVKGAWFEVEGFLGKKMQADAAKLPQIDLTSVLGPSPRARGDQVSSPDSTSDPQITGIFLRGDLQVIVPLYTWGMIESFQEAARRGVEAAKQGVRIKSGDVALRVSQAYWGLVLTKELRRLLEEIGTQMDEGVERVERLLEGGFSSEIDLYKLKTFQGEVAKTRNLVERGETLAKEALRAWLGLAGSVEGDVKEDRLPTELAAPLALELLIEESRQKRPEFTALREGILARKALVEAEKAKRYPLFFFGLFGSLAHATNRDRLTNPFVMDPLHHGFFGPVVGFKYGLDFGVTDGRIKEAEAEVGKLEALQAFAEEGIPLQIRKAYGELEEARKNSLALAEAFANAKKWVVAALANFDLGIGEAKDLADAVLAYARSQAEYFQALFTYQVGVAALEQAVGRNVADVAF